MAYTALYRRLRPQTFGDVIGQKHLIQTLQNQIANNRINHAYLFCGTRGTGKTSTAKIFARAINCEADGERPCNECSVCKNILDGRSLNVVEIDAASNNGVDNIRDIVEEVKYPPTEGRYKVYIIDEVHMLSVGAFNALLKTLEEPPAHVVFILATTDPQKLPVTILSRCQRFDFHRISKTEMAAELKKDMENEGVSITDEAIEYVTRLSDGAMRDALSILDQCMSFYYGEEITVDKIAEIMGTVDNDVLFRLTDAICASDCDGCLEVIDEIVQRGRDVLNFASDMVLHFRNLLLAISVGKDSEALDYSKEYIERLYEQGQRVSYNYILELISGFSELCNRMKYSSGARILLEVACIKACTPVTQNGDGALEKRLANLEKLLENGVPTAAVQPPTTPPPAEAPKKVERVVEKAVPEDVQNVVKHWKDFVKTIDSSLLRGLIMDSVEVAYLGNDIPVLVCNNSLALARCNNELNNIKKSLTDYFGKEFELKLMVKSDYQKAHKETYGAEDNELKFKSAEEEFKNKLNGVEIDIIE
jgi:DNA polymerase-3 subunit gamma/tau